MSFPMVALGEVIKHRNQFIQIDDLKNYKRCRVQLHVQGIVLRDIVLGAEIKTKKQQVCRTGDFLVAEIDAKVGGFGIVPPELHDSIVSSHYFLFVIDETRLDRRFLDFFIRTPYFREQVTAQGTTNYAAIRPTNVLGYKIPFLPLPEQRRIVARIEELAAKIEEARGLRKTAEEEGEAIMSAHVRSVFSSLAKKGLYFYKLAAEIANGQGLIEGDRDQAGEYAVFGSGGQVGKHNDALMTEPYVVIGRKGSAGKVTFASEGGWVTDTAYYAFPRNPKELECKYLFYATKSLDFTDDVITTAIPGINRTAIYAHKIPLPPLPEQRRIVAYLDALQAKVDALRRLQAETGAEMDALMPAVLDKAFKGEM